LTVSLIDTNILVYANNEDSPYHNTSKELIENALNGNIKAALAIQNLVELYAIITDKKRVEHPLPPDKAKRLIDFYGSNNHISIICPTHHTVNTIIKLIGKYRPLGQSIFDHLLVATMLDNNVNQIYTANSKHFESFGFLKVMNPLE